MEPLDVVVVKEVLWKLGDTAATADVVVDTDNELMDVIAFIVVTIGPVVDEE